jgi:thiamine-phosphate pyrophosphorylase
MAFNPEKPIIYLITSGQTSIRTTPATEDFLSVLNLVEAAVATDIDLVQIREKNLTARVLYTLSARAAEITRASATRLLVNDRADIASSAGADGVHLTTRSLPTEIIRRTFGADFLIGVSTHSLEEAKAAREARADFVVFGPIFQTPAKDDYGAPMGLQKLTQVASELKPFPVLALGGVTIGNAADCMRAGAQGIAAIRMLNDPGRLGDIVNEIRKNFEKR